MTRVENHRRLERLFDQHSAAVRAYALRRIDSASADDTVSEVFVVAWRRIDEIPDDALPWLLACARRVLANQHRGTKRRIALVDALASTLPGESRDLEGDSAGPLLAALARLSESDREVLMLIAWEGLDPASAAAVLGCSRPTLAVRLYRARRRLAVAVERSGSQMGIQTAGVEAVK